MSYIHMYMYIYIYTYIYIYMYFIYHIYVFIHSYIMFVPPCPNKAFERGLVLCKALGFYTSLNHVCIYVHIYNIYIYIYSFY